MLVAKGTWHLYPEDLQPEPSTGIPAHPAHTKKCTAGAVDKHVRSSGITTHMEAGKRDKGRRECGGKCPAPFKGEEISG